MGNNQLKSLGIRPGKAIGEKEFDKLWSSYAQGEENTLLDRDAHRFLKDLFEIIQVEYDEGTASMLIAEVEPDPYGRLSKEKFLMLLADTVEMAATSSDTPRKSNSNVTLARSLSSNTVLAGRYSSTERLEGKAAVDDEKKAEKKAEKKDEKEQDEKIEKEEKKDDAAEGKAQKSKSKK